MSDCYFVILSLGFLIVLRWVVSVYPYSGAEKPPMFGDFEAQRHWMEITYNLPHEEWYKNGTNNNLLYWGLDYPPLTAYHSWLCGFLSSKINTSWVEIKQSHGLSDAKNKLFMRYSVLVPDVIIYMTSVFFYFMKCDHIDHTFGRKEKLFSAVLMLLYPGLLLIDHGHFQYNCISLGLMIWAVNFAFLDRLCASSVLFVLALNYKQMELYHSFAFFFFFLGKILFSDNSTLTSKFFKLSRVGMSVIITFVLCWLPFLSSAEDVKHVITRLFPFNRGLFEDKVSNFWCSISILIKLKQIFDAESLIRICLCSTLLFCLPSSLNLLFKPSFKQFKYALVNSSLAFYLFSYQVHEKSILLPAVASLLLYSEHKLAVVWFQMISTFSMLPLLVKDGLLTPFLSCSILFCCVYSFHAFKAGSNLVLRAVVGVSILSVMSSMILILCVQPPQRLPDLFVFILSIISCIHFILFLIFFNLCQLIGLHNISKICANSTKMKLT